MTYTIYYQLVLNAQRVRLQRATEVALGIGATSTDEPLDDAWGDCLAATPEEGAEISHRANVARHEARVRRRLAASRGQ